MGDNVCSCGDKVTVTRRHAATYDRVVSADGHIEAEREFHYTTCKECQIENDANELAIRIAKLLQPNEWVRWKYLVERMLREYLEKTI